LWRRRRREGGRGVGCVSTGGKSSGGGGEDTCSCLKMRPGEVMRRTGNLIEEPASAMWNETLSHLLNSGSAIQIPLHAAAAVEDKMSPELIAIHPSSSHHLLHQHRPLE